MMTNVYIFVELEEDNKDDDNKDDSAAFCAPLSGDEKLAERSSEMDFFVNFLVSSSCLTAPIVLCLLRLSQK